jgi:hypothetical protein
LLLIICQSDVSTLGETTNNIKHVYTLENVRTSVFSVTSRVLVQGF